MVAAGEMVSLEKNLQPIKIQALNDSKEMSLEVAKLEAAVASLKIKVDAKNKMESLQAEARELALKMMSREQKEAIYDEMKEKTDRHLKEIKARYGL